MRKIVFSLISFFVALGSVAGCQPATFSWVRKADMSMPRSYFGLTPIDDKLYAIGGGTGEWSNVLDIAEVYDPKTNQWSSLPPLPTARRSLASAAIGSVIYTVGGDIEVTGVLGTLEAFDTKTNTWKKLAPMPTPRMDLAVVAAYGRIYAIGGFSGGDLNTVEVYDPQTNTWESAPPLPTSRYGLMATVIDGKIYVMGGRSKNELTPANEMYNPATKEWTNRAPMPEAFASFGLAAVGKRIHIIQDTHHYSYNPTTNTWRKETDFPEGRHSVLGAGLGNTFYAVGGCSEKFLDLAKVFAIQTSD